MATVVVNEPANGLVRVAVVDHFGDNRMTSGQMDADQVEGLIGQLQKALAKMPRS